MSTGPPFPLHFLSPAARWRLLDRGLIAGYFVANVVALVAVLPIMSGLIQRFSIMAGVDLTGYQTFLNNYQSLLQRVGAVIAFGPIAVSALYLDRQLSSGGQTSAVGVE